MDALLILVYAILATDLALLAIVIARRVSVRPIRGKSRVL